MRKYTTNAGATTAADFELDGTTPYTPLGTVTAAQGVESTVTAGNIVSPSSYSGTLVAGTYTRANILALTGGGSTKLLSMAVTCSTGTIDFAQGGGTIAGLTPGSIIDKPYQDGIEVDDFTITVNGSSTAYIEARAL